jgi:hypothetical protein
MEYSIFDPHIDRPLHELSREEAKDAYKWFISQKGLRKEELLRLCKERGVFITEPVVFLEKLHDFFIHEIKLDGIKDTPSNYIYSLCNDIAIYMGELLIENASNIKWCFFIKGKSHIYYQRPVLIGFENVKNKNYCIDFDYLLCQYAHRLFQGGEKEGELFKLMYECALKNTIKSS